MEPLAPTRLVRSTTVIVSWINSGRVRRYRFARRSDAFAWAMRFHWRYHRVEIVTRTYRVRRPLVL
jgi:hypothetical protein